jgi:hypothetical protein
MSSQLHQPNQSTNDTPSTDLSRRSFLGGLGALATVAAGGVGAVGALVPGATAEASEVGPLIGEDRLEAAFLNRLDAAERMRNSRIPTQTCNGDEDSLPNFIGNYSKGLPHNAIGEVRDDAYDSFLKALTSGEPNDFESIILGGVRKLTNPQAGLAFDTEGLDPHQFAQPAAPRFSSAEAAAEAVELYWMALLRDVRFDRYEINTLADRAAKELSDLEDFTGPRQDGKVTPQTLFRDNLPGCLVGPYISQFMLLGTPFGAEFVQRRSRVVVAGDDHMTKFDEWLAVQNGNVPGVQTFDTVRRYIRKGRDLGEWVHIDVLFQAYFDACLILLTPPEPGNDPTGGGIGCPLNPGNPYRNSKTQDPFGTWGGPAIKAVLCEVATRALKAVWFQKWFVHRRLRPETFGGRVHAHLSGLANYPIHKQVLESEAVDRIHNRFGTFLMPMAFPEGSPTHPAYGAGHATVAGACVTILKALFDENFEIPKPVVIDPTANGTRLVAFNGPALTVGGELNKLASNIGTGRNHAGVHWRTDAIESFRLGERIAISVLRDHQATFNEGGNYIFTTFDGNEIII